MPCLTCLDRAHVGPDEAQKAVPIPSGGLVGSQEEPLGRVFTGSILYGIAWLELFLSLCMGGVVAARQPEGPWMFPLPSMSMEPLV